MRWFLLLLTLFALNCDAARDTKAKREFQRENPCPQPGKRRGVCKGCEIDHINPLKCGGLDTIANMQWLTVGDHKAKTARETSLCLKPKTTLKEADTTKGES